MSVVRSFERHAPVGIEDLAVLQLRTSRQSRRLASALWVARYALAAKLLQLVRTGVRVFLYEPAILHAKTAVFDADLSAVELTDDPGHLASALVKIQTRQRRLMENLLTQVYGGTWWRTHPAAEERIRRLRQIERRSGLSPAPS